MNFVRPPSHHVLFPRRDTSLDRLWWPRQMIDRLDSANFKSWDLTTFLIHDGLHQINLVIWTRWRTVFDKITARRSNLLISWPWLLPRAKGYLMKWGETPAQPWHIFTRFVTTLHSKCPAGLSAGWCSRQRRTGTTLRISLGYLWKQLGGQLDRYSKHNNNNISPHQFPLQNRNRYHPV